MIDRLLEPLGYPVGMEYRCLPIGLCSWDYRIMHGDTIVVQTHHDWLNEQGSIEIGTRRLAVVKHGFMSGEWSLQEGGATIATALEPTAFKRRFELTMSGDSYELIATVMSRCFDLEKQGNIVASIAPDHLFTRRSSIHTAEPAPIELMTFAFWLAVLCWKRAADSSA